LFNRLHFILIIFVLAVCHAQAQNIARLRYDDDFTYLKTDTTSKSWDEQLKYMPLLGKATLSIGGEIREQYQDYTQANFGQAPAQFATKSPHQWMHRLLLHGDFKLNPHWRVFLQINNTARFLNPNPITSQLDQNLFSMHQWFTEVQVANKLILRAGRQEMQFGQERFVATKEGPTTRQSFIGIDAIYRTKTSKTDVFYTKPIKMNTGVWDDEISTEEFAGVHSTQNQLKPGLNVDAYYFYFTSDQREYVYKRGEETRHTYGLRLYSPLRKFNYDVELARQVGTFQQLKINALMAVWDFNWEVKSHQYLGFSGNYVPGDKSNNDGQLNTFNTLFARPPFGQTVALNISNTLNLSPYVRYQSGTKWLVTARASIVQRTSTEDGVYTPNMTQLRPYDRAKMYSNALKLCDIYALEFNYVPTKHYFFQFELGYCQAGNYLKQTGSGENVVYFAIRNAIKF
jgi:hypothetical protein